jgi:type I restriction enzyme S subunit
VIGTRLRHLAEINPSTPEFDQLDDEAMIPFVPLEAVWPDTRLDTSRRRPKGDVAVGYTRFREGDVLTPKITPTFEADRSTIACGLEGSVAAGTTELHVIRPGPHLDARYATYLVSSRPFLLGGAAEMIGVAGQKRVPDVWLRDTVVPVMDLAEQRAIADFLDGETGRIDALIAKKRRMIDLLRERHEAQVDHVTSRGELVRIRHVSSLITSGPRGWSERIGTEGLPFIRSANLRPNSLRLRRDNVVRLTDPRTKEASRSTARPGDTVIGITGANTGWVGFLTGADAPGFVSQHVAIIRPAGIHPRWLSYSLAARRSQDQLLAGQYGGTKSQLGLQDLADLTISLPSAGGQERAVETLDSMAGNVERLSATLTRQIDLLREHRQALITAAVTGELEVPGMKVA